MKSGITKMLFISLIFSAKISSAAEMKKAEEIPLITAICTKKTLEEIKFLIENDANVNEKSDQGYSALTLASDMGRLDV